MSTKVKSGDSINIPEGCKAVIEDGKVIFQPEFKDADYVPKRGDVVVCTYHVPYSTYDETVTAICTGHRDKFGTYDCFVIYEHGGIIKRNKGIPVVNKHDQYQSKIRLATDEEKEILFDKMKEQRLYWDAKNYNVFLERWRAENNGTYYFVNANFKVESTYDTYCSIDDYLYNIGNYFRDEYDAKSIAMMLVETTNKLKSILLQYHDKLGK